MRLSEFIVPSLLAAVMHGGLLLPGIRREAPRADFRAGETALTLHLRPSIASAEVRPADVPTDQDAPAPEAPETMAPVPRVPAEFPVATEDVHIVSAPAMRPDDPRPMHVAGAPTAQRAPVEAVRPAARPRSDEPPASWSQEVPGDLRDQGVNVPVGTVGLTKPQYPAYSVRHGEEGDVVLTFAVLPHGRAGHIEVVSSSGYRRLDRAAISAVARAVFRPARRAGVPVASAMRITFRFRLEDAR